jgi:hypothetical protein
MTEEKTINNPRLDWDLNPPDFDREPCPRAHRRYVPDAQAPCAPLSKD